MAFFWQRGKSIEKLIDKYLKQVEAWKGDEAVAVDEVVVLLQAVAPTASVRTVGKKCPINWERPALCRNALSAEQP